MVDLDRLALAAVTTPSLDAPAALDVLVDALLEKGVLREDQRPNRSPVRGRAEYAPLFVDPSFANLMRDELRIDAIEWARGRLLLWCDAVLAYRTEADADLRARILAVFRRGTHVDALDSLREAFFNLPSIDTATGADLDRLANIFGLERSVLQSGEATGNDP